MDALYSFALQGQRVRSLPHQRRGSVALLSWQSITLLHGSEPLKPCLEEVSSKGNSENLAAWARSLIN